ncbi:helix-turn-helix domain-containing protein [Photorhabdus viridis]
MKRAIKVRLYPTVEQAEFLNAQFGAVGKSSARYQASL